VSKEYHILSKKASTDLAKTAAANSQIMLPMVGLIEDSQMAVDELIETLGRATIEAVLLMSAVEWPENHQGRKGADVLRHGGQAGVATLVRTERCG